MALQTNCAIDTGAYYCRRQIAEKIFFNGAKGTVGWLGEVDQSKNHRLKNLLTLPFKNYFYLREPVPFAYLQLIELPDHRHSLHHLRNKIICNFFKKVFRIVGRKVFRTVERKLVRIVSRIMLRIMEAKTGSNSGQKSGLNSGTKGGS